MKKGLVALFACIFLVGVAAHALAVGTSPEAEAMVKQAAAFVEANGKEKAFAAFSDKKGQFIKEDLYIFAIDITGKVLAHGGNPALVGKDMSGAKDADGKLFIKEIIEAAKTKPFGFQAFYPGPGIGGHCIPLDPFYLEHIAKKYDFDLTMIHAAGHINMRMPHYMSIKISTALNKHRKPVNGSKILFLGVAYKPNIDDARESPALQIMDMVVKKGGIVSYSDPYIPEVKTPRGKIFQSVELTSEALQDADCVVIATNHRTFDAEFIQKHAKLIVDLRNVISKASNQVFKL